ncbi:flagellar hook-associated protein 3 [bacterium]|nr:MAG: flagellar hook-associated protein 3 [bacterium]
MRISTQSQYDGYASRIRDTQARVIDAGTKVQDGKRMHKASDDPTALGAVLDIRAYKSSVETYQKNLARGTGLLKGTESALAEIGTGLDRGTTLAIAGANSTVDAAGRKAMAIEIDSIRKRLVELGNTRDADGTYLFAGQKSDKTPFAVDANGVLNFNGDANPILVESDAGETIAANVDGAATIQTAYRNLTKLRDALEGNDVAGLGDLRLGEMQGSKKEVDALRGVVGTKISTMASRTENHDRRIDELTTRASDLEEVDFADALVQYQAAQTAYQAALQVTSTASRTSLMDYLR